MENDAIDVLFYIKGSNTKFMLEGSEVYLYYDIYSYD